MTDVFVKRGGRRIDPERRPRDKADRWDHCVYKPGNMAELGKVTKPTPRGAFG